MSNPLASARILAVESSCDETAAAILEDGRTVLSSVVASQVDLHAQFGGVFPEVASRQHIRTIYPIVESALQQAHLSLTDLDAIAVTRGPGLPGSLVIGMNAAKGLALGSGLPLVGVNHLEGHIYSAWVNWPASGGIGIDVSSATPSDRPVPEFPLVVLIVSGGHTELILMNEHLTYQRLGATLDDAAGEAFDKVARLIGLPYPGGPAVQKAAINGNLQAFRFPRAWLDDSWNFSFSGLKTAVMREVRKLQDAAAARPGGGALPVADLAASFQAAVVDVLVSKTLRAAEQYGTTAIVVSGGVSANQALRQAFLEGSPVPVFIPPLALCTDNAAMIAAAGYFRFAHGQRDGLDIDVMPNWPLSEI